jgi:hypothetical protein
MEFLRFTQRDPEYGEGFSAQVVVSVAQIVKVEPRWYATDAKGQRFLAQAASPGEEELMEGLQKSYLIFDSLGNRYSSELLATDDGRKAIERIWLEAK